MTASAIRPLRQPASLPDLSYFTRRPPEEIVEELRVRILEDSQSAVPGLPERVIPGVHYPSPESLRKLLPFVPAHTIIRAAREVYSPHEFSDTLPTERELHQFALNIGFERCLELLDDLTNLGRTGDLSFVRHGIEQANQFHLFDASVPLRPDEPVNNELPSLLGVFIDPIGSLKDVVKKFIQADMSSGMRRLRDLAFMEAAIEARNTEETGGHLPSPIDRWVHDYLRDRNNCVIVDWGAGRPGKDVLELYGGKHTLILMDRSPYVTEFLRFYAQIRGIKARILEGDASDISLRPGSVDVSRATGFVHDLKQDEQDAFIDVVSSAMKPGGLVVTEDHTFQASTTYALSPLDYSDRMQAFQQGLAVRGFQISADTRDVATSLYGNDTYLFIRAVKT